MLYLCSDNNHIKIEIMTMHKLYNTLTTSNGYFEYNQGTADVSEGWKLSIQGKTVQDATFLYEALRGLLSSTKCSFKIGTQKLIDGIGYVVNGQFAIDGLGFSNIYNITATMMKTGNIYNAVVSTDDEISTQPPIDFPALVITNDGFIAYQ